MHDRGIQLDHALFVGQPAQSDAVLVRVVLQEIHARNHGLERVRAVLDQLHRLRGRPRSVAAGNDQGPHARGLSCLRIVLIAQRCCAERGDARCCP